MEEDFLIPFGTSDIKVDFTKEDDGPPMSPGDTMLLEIGDVILLENGDQILLEA